MKSLEEVIKQKCKFRGRTGWGEEDHFILYKRSFYEYDYIPLYISNDEVRSENIITLLKEMKSLIVFLFSCVKYDEEANDVNEETRKLHFKIEFHADPLGPLNEPLGESELVLTDSIFSKSLHWYDSPIYFIESVIEDIRTKGHYTSFDDSFTFAIIISLIKIDLERFISNPDGIDLDRYAFNPNINLDNVRNRINNENNNEGTIPINEGKTFKNDLCTICLERIPNVLFCLCGHICICEKCNEIKKLNSCPICKTENNILSII